MEKLNVCLLPLVLVWILGLEPCGANTVADENRKVILVLVDGVRWDYLNETDLHGFETLADNGVKAEYVVPIMPSNSYPNWYTIVTGLYAEDHGFVHNYMYDEVQNDFFFMTPHPNASHPHWWNHAEPIWITAEKNGMRTSMYWWDGCQVIIRGMKPSHCAQYIGYWHWRNVNLDYSFAFNHILDRLENDDVDFVLVYYEGVDANGHVSGPNSRERKRALRDIDSLLMDLQTRMKKKNLENKVNLVVVSDHGMVDTRPEVTTHIDMRTYLDPSDIHSMLGDGSFSMLRPYANKVDKVYNHLISAGIRGLQVYKKEDLPEAWHLKHTYLTQPIVLAADKGYSMIRLQKPEISRNITDHIRVYNGGHGYDPVRVKEMRTIFLARGPGLKEGYVSKPLNQVDHYNVLCHLLGIPANQNSGNLEAAEAMYSGSRLSSSVAALSMILPAIVLLFLCLLTDVAQVPYDNSDSGSSGRAGMWREALQELFHPPGCDSVPPTGCAPKKLPVSSRSRRFAVIFEPFMARRYRSFTL